MSTELILPPGVERPEAVIEGRGMVVNETDLPNNVVLDVIEEHASVLGMSSANTFQSYSNNGGGLLARPKFRTPGSIFEEIMLARDMVERDDDIGAALGSMLAVAYSDGMQMTHRDDISLELSNKIAEGANYDSVLPNLHRELLITSQIVTVTAFVSEDLTFLPSSGERFRSRTMQVPRIGTLPPENVRVLGTDWFGTGTLAWKPTTATQERWLTEYFSPDTSPGRKAEMRAQDPVLTSMLTSEVVLKDPDTAIHPEQLDQPSGTRLYTLNPRMVHRSTQPKGAWNYPRPLLTRDFQLLEAKRLLNIMDYALLMGGSNFLVVAKKGSKEQPAKQPEVDNLREQLRRASRSGVMVGDHRLEIEIITPNLTELLNAEKRRMLGRKLANGMLRVPEQDDDAGGEGMKARLELMQRVITLDRRLVKRHLERGPHREVVRRNQSHFTQGMGKLWFPKIILSGTQYFTDYVLKMRDRGDISRTASVEAGGFDMQAELGRRKAEKANGDDRVMTPPVVPFTGNGPQLNDNGGGRPTGSSPNNGAPGAQRRDAPARARPRTRISRNAGETVVAMVEDEVGTFRAGELTHAILEEYADTKDIGRITKFERTALNLIQAEEAWPGTFSEGPLTIVPVNPGHMDLEEFAAIRLAPGVSMLLGYRSDDKALVARAFCFREPEYSKLDAEEAVLRWGYDAEGDGD